MWFVVSCHFGSFFLILNFILWVARGWGWEKRTFHGLLELRLWPNEEVGPEPMGAVVVKRAALIQGSCFRPGWPDPQYSLSLWRVQSKNRVNASRLKTLSQPAPVKGEGLLSLYHLSDFEHKGSGDFACCWSVAMVTRPKIKLGDF